MKNTTKGTRRTITATINRLPGMDRGAVRLSMTWENGTVLALEKAADRQAAVQRARSVAAVYRTAYPVTLVLDDKTPAPVTEGSIMVGVSGRRTSPFMGQPG